MVKRDQQALENKTEAAGKRIRVSGPRTEEQEPVSTTTDSGGCDDPPEEHAEENTTEANGKEIGVMTPRGEEQDSVSPSTHGRSRDSSQTTTSTTAQAPSTGGPSGEKSMERSSKTTTVADTKAAIPGSNVVARKQQSKVTSSKNTQSAKPAISKSVQSIIPRPTSNLLDDIQIEPYGDLMRKRLKDLSEYVNESANTYALAKLLPTATWGRYTPRADHRKVMCNPATNKPIVIWIVGHIMSLWFAKNGYAERQGSITVLPLSSELAKQSSALMAGLSNNIPNPSPEDTINAIRAITWQSASNDSPPELFANVYDATEAFKAKNVMPDYDVTDLEKDDLVLIECKLTRYQSKNTDNNVWTQRAQMELLAISLIHKRLDRTEAEEDCENVIEDVCI